MFSFPYERRSRVPIVGDFQSSVGASREVLGNILVGEAATTVILKMQWAQIPLCGMRKGQQWRKLFSALPLCRRFDASKLSVLFWQEAMRGTLTKKNGKTGKRKNEEGF